MFRRLGSKVYSRVVQWDVLHPWLYRNSFYIGQGGQDLWVFGEAFNQLRGGYFLDIGAFDGVTHSNTFLLEKRYKWRGICIEANPGSFKQLREARNCICEHACLDQETGKEVTFTLEGMGSAVTDDSSSASDKGKVKLQTTRLQDVLERHNAPQVIDYCSIDIEGAEDRLFAGVDLERYLFRTMTIERPSAAVRQLLHAKGYVLVREIPQLDAFYIHESFTEAYRANCLSFNYKKFLALRWR